ncbi:Protein kinase domain-containing protein ppk32 [Sphaceloma murrayae]|uniref:Protein kinase domain-containing protein ppk32 n=1 Tax=Sphaceloma murrayae TaxID=2082308 RepID=A0A2K1R1A0_9PEZI|nr:Protein kinase domain-containing protein ppk32 [Sphaceloma murrayae]
MFSSALKSFSSNITANYSLSPQPISYCGPWKIYDAKRKSTGKAASVFVFEKKSLEPQGGGLGGRSGATSVKAAQQEVIDRLKREASSLARLRHPNILELAEPVEDTRNGGLMFATEQVTASLAALLADQDDQERAGKGRGRSSRYVVKEAEEGKAAKEFELDELEIQKGLLQIGKGLEFLHESAGLVHGNLTPDAIIVNSKGDWKITGMSFTGPASDSNKPSSSSPIYLSEVLNHDPRLPQSVQLDLDYTSPDFVLDNNLTSAADMFSLGLLIVALYNSPHKSPVECHGSLSSYKRTFASSATVPSINNNFLAKGTFPQVLASDLLPKLITRRPAQRLTAKTFQQAQYFDNILVSTIRFLDSLPTKSVSEKNQFLKGLPRIMPQFPTSVLERKILPALLEEMKDRDLLAAILQNVFAIIKASSDGKRPFIDQVIPKLREVFVPAAGKASTAEKDLSKEAGLMVVLENMQTVADSTSGKEFRDDILPVIAVGLTSSTHAIIDAALSTLPYVTPKLDYTTIKNELFPVIAVVFAHTNSLAIKIQGLEAFYTLCGGSEDSELPMGDGLDGSVTNHGESRANSSAVLDKFTIQEKIVPMMKGIKTKEPAVMLAALKVFKQIGKVVDTDFLATDILPILWAFALGPLLDLQQFQTFMTLIKSLSARIEREHSRKLQELSTGNASASVRVRATGTRMNTNTAAAAATNGEDIDFESLVSGRKNNGTPDMINDWDGVAKPTVSSSMNGSSPWASQTTSPPTVQSLRPQNTAYRSVTPDQSLNAFASLTPSNTFNAPLQPNRASSISSNSAMPMRPAQPQQPTVDWSSALSPTANIWAQNSANSSAGNSPMAARNPSANYGMASNSFSIAPPPKSPPIGGPVYGALNGSTVTRPMGQPMAQAMAQRQQQILQPQQALQSQPQQKSGLDKYESLL